MSENDRDYDQVIIKVFQGLITHYGTDSNRLPFTMVDIRNAAADLGLVIQNFPDVTYTYRVGRSTLPAEIQAYGNWAIEGAGKGKYAFVKLTRDHAYIQIPTDFEITPILDATPLIVLKYQKSDEQALLAQLRYNRLMDIFTGLTTYHLQSHYRTTIEGIGQVEIDDLYIGVNTDGEGFVIPVEAKAESPKDQLGVIQVTQMIRFARQYFPELPVRPIGVKLLSDQSMMFLEFTPDKDPDQVNTRRIKCYHLVRDQGR